MPRKNREKAREQTVLRSDKVDTEVSDIREDQIVRESNVFLAPQPRSIVPIEVDAAMAWPFG